MKRTLFLILLAVCLFACSLAYATDLEIVYPNVIFRSKPNGSTIGTFTGGEVLSALDETWSGNRLWYHAHSDTLGNGYVAGEFARPIYADERVFTPENPTRADYVTENVVAFYTSFYRYLYQFGYCYWDEAENVCQFRVKNGVGDASIIRPASQWDIANMLLRYGLLVETEETTLLRSENLPAEEMQRIASAALRNHFGTDDIWQIIIKGGILNYSEVHAPYGDLSSSDNNRLRAVREQVNGEYVHWSANVIDGQYASTDIVLYYNPDGGSRYHVDLNCPSTSSKYLPLAGRFTWAEINDEQYAGLMPCSVCGAPER